MKPIRLHRFASATIAFPVMTAFAVAATPISISNPSFESPALPAFGAAVGTPTGWTGNGPVGYVANRNIGRFAGKIISVTHYS